MAAKALKAHSETADVIAMRILENIESTATCSGSLTETAVDHLGHFICSSPTCPVMAPRHEEYTTNADRASRIREGHLWGARF